MRPRSRRVSHDIRQLHQEFPSCQGRLRLTRNHPGTVDGTSLCEELVGQPDRYNEQQSKG